MPDKRLESRIHQELLQLSNKKANKLVEKWAKALNRHSSEANIQMASKCLKRCLTSVAIRKIQIKTTVRSHSTPTRMGKKKCW